MRALTRTRLPSLACPPRCFSSSALDSSHPPSVIVLGGLGMKERALEKVTQVLYPTLAAQRFPHTLHQIVNVRFSFPSNIARLQHALENAGPGGAILHIFSGAAFFSVTALREWGAAAAVGSTTPASRIRGLVLDSIPYKRVELKLMEVAKVPPFLVPAALALASRLLVSPAVGATVALTDAYQEAQLDARTFSCTGGRRVLVAHSADDVIVPVEQYQAYVAALQGREGWETSKVAAPREPSAAPGSVELTTYEGRGRHAALVLDDSNYVAAVHEWVHTL